MVDETSREKCRDENIINLNFDSAHAGYMMPSPKATYITIHIHICVIRSIEVTSYCLAAF